MFNKYTYEKIHNRYKYARTKTKVRASRQIHCTIQCIGEKRKKREKERWMCVCALFGFYSRLLMTTNDSITCQKKINVETKRPSIRIKSKKNKQTIFFSSHRWLYSNRWYFLFVCLFKNIKKDTFTNATINENFR